MIDKLFRNQFFVYTDSDIYLPDCVPDDFLQHFYDILVHTPYTSKVGCALRIDDLPDCYARKEEVLQWEQRFWQHPVGPDMYLSDIDTTFALHKPNLRIGHRETGHRIRVAGPYACQHRPWYVDSAHLDSEEQQEYHDVWQTFLHSSTSLSSSGNTLRLRRRMPFMEARAMP